MSLPSYLKTVEKNLSAGNATEHTHRAALQNLIESLAPGVTATNEPKRIQCGAPDYIVTRGQTPLGYIEAKDVGVSLESAQKSTQLKRYRESLGNLILTDYLEFRWFVRDELRLTARLARVGANGKLMPDPDGAAQVEQLLSAFLNTQVETVGSAKELAERMAAISQLIRDTIERALKAEDLTDDIPDPLHDQLKSFREVLIHDLTEEQFADMYAQTLCYGLFAARCNARTGERFTREHAAHDLPKTNPFLRKLFNQIAGIDLDPRIAWAVDDLAELLNRTDVDAVLKDFGRSTRREDPVVHFYETFLAAYDPAMREARGVYYTPEPVVSYIVRSVDHILKTDFKLRDGLADSGKIKFKGPQGALEEVHKVLILDPATGTGTFLHGVVSHIYESLSRNRGMWSSYVSKHLLPRLFGFELLMAPYSVAHMKLGLQLAQTGYEFNTDERLRVYLTNTLEEVHQLTSASAFTRWLNEEADAASRVKQETPVMVVLGNPPYSGHSANAGAWISNLLRGRDTQTGKQTSNYFEVDGQPLGERNPKWLNDDYVKFIRFAQWRIEQTGYGVLAFISNHGYLDNPTFRGMRQSLIETFDDIYVLDLHGNSKKKERAPDGSKDENVFDIQQGVAIGIFVKRADTEKRHTNVGHAHLYGVREVYDKNESGERVLSGGKYGWLWQHEISSTEWTTINPQAPSYLLVPQNTDLLPEYNEFWPVPKIFEVSASTVTTARNDFSMAEEPQILVKRINDLRDKSIDDQTLKTKYNLKDVSYWKLSTARKELAEIKDVPSFVKPYCYRPFDFRYVYYHGAVCERLRYEVMQHMREDNLALLTHRPQSPGDFTFAYCTRMIGDQCVAASKSAGGGNSFQFPLYIYPTVKKTSLFDADERVLTPGGRRPNLTPEFVAEAERRLGMAFIPDGSGDCEETFGPDDLFAYMYAILHSPTYRSRYAEFLKNDFPRVHLTSNATLFYKLSDLGDDLVSLHLLEEHAPDIASFPVGGSNAVEVVRYTAPGPDAGDGRVWINSEQYFEGIPPAVWNFHVGGYQVCQKWLKDRKGRALSYDELMHYQHLVGALAETMRLMAEIDLEIESAGGWPLT